MSKGIDRHHVSMNSHNHIKNCMTSVISARKITAKNVDYREGVGPREGVREWGQADQRQVTVITQFILSLQNAKFT